MIVENPDAFKSWLTAILEPICDADPEALAKYIYALVKKDKHIDEIRKGMLDQLDVFLQQETKPFVDMLFKSLDVNEHLQFESKKEPLPPTVNAEVTLDDKDLPKEETEMFPENNNTNVAPVSLKAPVAPRPKSPVTAHRVVLPRAPKMEQTLVKVMPLTELLEEPVDQPPRRRDRREIRDRDERKRRRSRSWERRPRNRRHRSPDNDAIKDNNRRRPPSRSPSPRGRYRNRSPPPAASDRTSRSRSRSPAIVRERDRLRPREIERDRVSRDRDHRDRVARSRDRERSHERSRDRSLSPLPDSRLEAPESGYKRRCRDFDEKGYCMRGDLCQWDHGADPVVLEDTALTNVLAPPPEYNPLAPDIWGATAPPGAVGFPNYPPPHPHMPPRALVLVPRMREMGSVNMPAPPGPPPPPRHPAPKKNFDYNRMGKGNRPPHSHGGHNSIGNCSLEVRKVPFELNDITHLNSHFCKFGKIVNIQVSFEKDPEAALITFSNHTEASIAYKSTEAVLNNRFIKVFWHNSENKQENVAPSNKQNITKPSLKSNNHQFTQNKVLINKDNIKATADNKIAAATEAASKSKDASNGQDELKTDTLEKVVTPAPDKQKKVMEMYKRAQELMETQLDQQMKLIKKLEDGKLTAAQKIVVTEALNSAQEGIEKMRKELLTYSSILKQLQEETVARSMSRLHLQAAKRPKTREEAHKEILDAELDMFNKQHEGQDVSELAKKIADMRRRMSIQFPTHPSMKRPLHASRGGRFNTATRFTRGAPTQKVFVNQSVDHRPRALLISGFETDDLEPLVAHFTRYGEVTGKEVNLAVPELVLQYKLRASAEQAMIRGKNYNDRTLSITWVDNSKPIAPINSAAPAPQNGSTTTNETQSKEGEVSQETTEDALLRFDEEEEEEIEEDRSWRR